MNFATAVSHNLPLVVVAVFIATYTISEYLSRFMRAEPQTRRKWVILTTTIIGLGIWTIHFLEGLAFYLLENGVYQLSSVLYSVLLSGILSILILLFFSFQNNKMISLTGASVSLAICSTCIHYFEMKAMYVPLNVSLHGLVLSTLGVAVLSFLGFCALMRLRSSQTNTVSVRWKAVAALYFGAALSFQHFGTDSGTGTALTEATLLMESAWIEYAVSISLCVFLSLILYSLLMDRRAVLKEAVYSYVRFRSLYDHNPIPVMHFDLDGKILSVNQAHEKVTGYHPEEVIGRSFLNFTMGLDPNWINQLLTCVKEGKTQEEEITLYHKQGHAIDLHITCVPTIVENEIVGVYAIAEDITSRKTIEKALRESEAKYRLIAENMSDLIGILDLDGTIQYASPSHDLVLSEPVETYLGTYSLNLVHPDDSDFVKQTFRRVVATKSSGKLECRFVHRDKTWIDLEVTFMPVLNGQEAVEKVILIAHDITVRKQAERRLEESEERYRSLFENNTDAVFSINSRGRITSVNPASIRITGYEPEELLNKSFMPFVVPEDQDKLMFHYKMSKKGDPQDFELDIYDKAGERVSLHINTIPAMSAKSRVEVFGIARDITERKQAERTINHMAYHDALTELANRRLFKERLNNALLKAKENGTMLAVMFLDLDRFKIINDTLGHDVGDLLLQDVAKKLSDCLGEGSMLARMGGDEFTILMSAITDREQAIQLAKEILLTFEQPFQFNDQDLHVSTSIGIALYPRDGEDAETLMKHADLAMYRAKDLGKNNYKLYAAHSEAVPTLLLVNSLHYALERQEFELFYQPQIDIKSGSIIGMEALLRWNHPDLGMLSPAQFITLAEETGLIVPISEWVLREACQQNRRWQDAGYPRIKVAVNLATRQFQQRHFVQSILHILQETGLEPQYLELELTERIAMHNVDSVIMKLNALKERGIHISIDDFGTGYSSLGYLKKFPINTLKIDRSFVTDITSDTDSIFIARAIISMAHSLRLNVLAEGVETIEQLAVLEELGCQEAQGFLLSRPLPPLEFQQLLNERPVYRYEHV